MRGQAEGELSTSGMTHDHDFAGVQTVTFDELRQEPVGASNIFKSAGPAAAGVADAAILHIPGGESFRGQCRAQMSSVSEIVFGSPEAAVNVHDALGRAFAFGQTNLAELVGIGSVGMRASAPGGGG